MSKFRSMYVKGIRDGYQDGFKSVKTPDQFVAVARSAAKAANAVLKATQSLPRAEAMSDWIEIAEMMQQTLIELQPDSVFVQPKTGRDKRSQYFAKTWKSWRGELVYVLNMAQQNINRFYSYKKDPNPKLQLDLWNRLNVAKGFLVQAWGAAETLRDVELDARVELAKGPQTAVQKIVDGLSGVIATAEKLPPTIENGKKLHKMMYRLSLMADNWTVLKAFNTELYNLMVHVQVRFDQNATQVIDEMKAFVEKYQNYKVR